MSVRFVVEETAISGEPTDRAATKASHARFIELWLKYGVLVTNSSGGCISKNISNIPEACRKIWELALKSDKFRKTSESLGDANATLSSEESIKAWLGKIDLVCLEETRAELDFVDDGGHAKYIIPNSLEVCRFDCADQSNSFKIQKEIWDRHIHPGETLRDVWTRRFVGLVRYSRYISIVDRYAGKMIIEKTNRGEKCGLLKLLYLIDSVSDTKMKKKVINLYTSDTEVDLQKLKETLGIAVKTYGRNLASFRVFVGEDRAFRILAHDRFLRFDGLVTSVGRGTALFENPEISSTYSCSLSPDIDGDFEAKIEKALRVSSEQILIL